MKSRVNRAHVALATIIETDTVETDGKPASEAVARIVSKLGARRT